VLQSGVIDVSVSWEAPIAYGMSADRKLIARDAEASVRRMTAAALRQPARPPADGESPEAADAVPKPA
jgi:1-acyl-sn-glycerol-3-phosphate acyltransferase